MRKGVAVVAAAVALALIGACTDDDPPASRSSSAAPVSSGSDLALSRTLARSLVDGLQQGANGRISTVQADCLTDAIGNGLRPSVLADISSAAPEPAALPRDVRETFGRAFERCLDASDAKQLRQRFGL